MDDNAFHEGWLRITDFKSEILKLKLNHEEKGLTRHEYRIALSELLNRNLLDMYRPKKKKP